MNDRMRLGPAPGRRIAVLLISIALASCGSGGGTNPAPGIYSGAGTDDPTAFTISFTVTPDLEISTLLLGVETISNPGVNPSEIEGPWPVENGEFEMNLRDGLGLQDITVEGQFTDDGTTATGSYKVELTSGAELTDGESPDSAGTWSAATE